MYNLNYFIEKFEAIPEEQWCVGTTDNGRGQHCALGHCGMDNYSSLKEVPEALALKDLTIHRGISVVLTNDMMSGMYRQSTPKQRILAMLYGIKAKEVVEEAQLIANTPTEVLEEVQDYI